MGRINKAGTAGLILCFCAVLFGVATNGGLASIVNYIHIPSLIVTGGGAMFAVLATADSFADYIDGLKSIVYAYKKPEVTTEYVSDEILKISDMARKEGLLSLDEYAMNLDNEFLSRGIRLVVDGSEPDLVRGILENELTHKDEKNRKRIHFWQDLGAYAPAWGMLGTLIGLIEMMRSMGNDAGSLGAGMALALITTLYGSLIANWLCIPVSRKLQKTGEQESLIMELIIEGVLSVQAGENSRIIREKIRSILDDYNGRETADLNGL